MAFSIGYSVAIMIIVQDIGGTTTIWDDIAESAMGILDIVDLVQTTTFPDHVQVGWGFSPPPLRRSIPPPPLRSIPQGS